MNLAHNLRRAREALGLSQADLAQEATKLSQKPISQQYINNIETGKSLRPRELDAIARVLGVTSARLTFGEVQADGGESAERQEQKGGVLVWETPEDLPEDSERVWIDKYEYHFSAGNGAIQWEVREKKALPFNMSFFRSIGSKPQDCKLLVVRGDSMEPFLFHRDVFMIDEAKTRVSDGGIYAVHFEDEALVKQVFKESGGGVRLHSYNPAFPDRFIPATEMGLLRIVGKLVYRSGAGPAT
ncbi:LexA family transcriptional regulator [Paraburkholderia sp. SIMBA_050]|uniref:Phage repressor protein C, contains Cro/C1-type HTH and peptisase s24 domains n=1 Tax=Paraburkholderia terricola TaxID=169427 RepID=A0A1M6YPR6_9BURK|nr:MULTISPECIES: LexA family transcriptional regulator [Paraburkholderia]AXE94148.1 LexA family transcriptional repressor [Paraburkholderia terricola]MDR6445577.1 transcriptional regulator with XRE-family HTH domain [Paraburkholderia terricola]SDP41266.1 Phage repressor protein C, contains Cro/C1-type HTH and peptisase s24 domains [Paraburkholderia sediminicola]SHL20019.1 Phage repressor protein C, contains Cro/C1-type HTH and peptisase s24 domains [Paraburkholderia terricola]